MVKRLLLFALLACLFAYHAGHAAEYTASVDRKELVMDESITLTLSLFNSDTRLRAEGLSPNVDLSVLARDFDLDTPRADNRYNIYRGRGRSTSEISVRLLPRRAGRLTIPSFGIDGLQTAPITVQVHALPAGSPPEAYSRSGISKRSAWLREQFVVWLDVYHRNELKSAKLGSYIETEPVRIELLEHRQLPAAKREEKIKGITYQVERLAWAIVPKQSGSLRIALPDVWLVMHDKRELRLPSHQETITIKPLPAEVTDDIPVGKLELTQTAPDKAATVNEVSSWTITARGPVSRAALPDKLPLAPAPAAVRLYSEPAHRSFEDTPLGFITLVTYTLSVIPQSTGTVGLPPVRIPYFDPARGTLETAELPGQILTVNAVMLKNENAIAPALASSDTTPVTQAPVTDTNRLWQFVSLGFAGLWLSTLILWWRSSAKPAVMQQPRQRTNSSPSEPQTSHPLQAALLEAFGSRTLEQGLYAWEARHGVNEEIRAAVRTVQELCYGRNRTADTQELRGKIELAASLIRAASRLPTANKPDPWSPEAFAGTLHAETNKTSTRG